MEKDKNTKQAIFLTDIKVDSTYQTNPKDMGELANSAIRSGKKKYVQAEVIEVDDKTRTITLSIPLGYAKDMNIYYPKGGINAYPTEDFTRHVEKYKKNLKVNKKHKK